MAIEQYAKQANRTHFVQRLVSIPAFGRLDAGRAASRTLAGADRIPGRGQPGSGLLEAALGKSGAAFADHMGRLVVAPAAARGATLVFEPA